MASDAASKGERAGAKPKRRGSAVQFGDLRSFNAFVNMQAADAAYFSACHPRRSTGRAA
ncbi:MAG: hypothetical protein OTI36_04760 [Beijerinckiaceae bacterium]|nr:hypothetical protein [Beijerinckiaceae bacterium]